MFNERFLVGIGGDQLLERLLDRLFVPHLVPHWIADPDRICIVGWSYGGYMSAMALARAPETFHVAVAGAPVSRGGMARRYVPR